MDRILRLGTRGSPLALYQANAVSAALARLANVRCEIVVIKTSGDRLAEATLSEIGGKRLFVKEIEEALETGVIDLAVHSSKDMPAVLPPGLVIAAVLPREDPRDAIVLPAGAPAGSIDDVLARLGPTPRIGTSSVRRIAQLTRLMPQATFLPIRGNLDTRLRKLDEGEFDAIVLAAAGLKRLERTARISALIPADACVPAPGQGIIAIEVRGHDTDVCDLVARIGDTGARAALDAERTVVAALGGGCQMPIGAHARLDDAVLALTAVVTTLDGQRIVRAHVRSSADQAASAGTAVAAELLAGGAADILEEVARIQRGTGGQTT